MRHPQGEHVGAPGPQRRACGGVGRLAARLPAGGVRLSECEGRSVATIAGAVACGGANTCSLGSWGSGGGRSSQNLQRSGPRAFVQMEVGSSQGAKRTCCRCARAQLREYGPQEPLSPSTPLQGLPPQPCPRLHPPYLLSHAVGGGERPAGGLCACACCVLVCLSVFLKRLCSCV